VRRQAANSRSLCHLPYVVSLTVVSHVCRLPSAVCQEVLSLPATPE
jgi:hypothetical protein